MHANDINELAGMRLRQVSHANFALHDCRLLCDNVATETGRPLKPPAETGIEDQAACRLPQGEGEQSGLRGKEASSRLGRDHLRPSAAPGVLAGERNKQSDVARRSEHAPRMVRTSQRQVMPLVSASQTHEAITMFTLSYRGFWLHGWIDRNAIRLQRPDYTLVGTFPSLRAAKAHVRKITAR